MNRRRTQKWKAQKSPLDPRFTPNKGVPKELQKFGATEKELAEGQERFNNFMKNKVAPIAKTVATIPNRLVKELPNQIALGAKGLAFAVNAAKDVVTGGKNMKNNIKKAFELAGQAHESGKYIFTGKNHPSWYLNYPVGGLIGANFARRKGITEDGIINSGSNGNLSIPSIMGINLALTIPHDGADTYFQSMNFLFNKIRRANAGAVNYGPQELAYYVDSIRSIHAMYCMARRAYATLFSFAGMDATVPASYFAAYGLDYYDFRNNAANLRSQMQIYSNLIKELCPYRSSVIDRTDWLFSNVFKDSNDVKSSLYTFTLGACNMYTFTGGAWTVQLMPIASNLTSTSTGTSYNTFMQSFDSLLDSFRNVSVFQIIAGDILKAYGTSALYDNGVWPERMEVPEIYDEAVLTQIQNATVVESINVSSSTPADDYNGNIVVSIDANGMPRHDFKIAGPSSTNDPFITDQISKFFTDPFINMYKDNIDTGDLLSATRFRWVVQSTPTTWDNANPIDTSIQKVSFGTELILRCRPILVDSKSNNLFHFSAIQTGYVGLNLHSIYSILPATLVWSTFDWAPYTVYTMPDSSGHSKIVAYLWDFNNYARANYDQIDIWNQTASLSLYYAEGRFKESKTERYS